jgi:hypothetical protein
VPEVVIGEPATLKNDGTDAATLVTEPLLLNVVQSVLVRYPLTELVAAAIEIAGVVPPDDTTGAVPVTAVTVPPLDGLVFVTVKLGYVPETLMPVPAVNATVWSGAVFVMVNVPLEVIGLPDTEIPVPALAATLVTVPVFPVSNTPLAVTVFAKTAVESWLIVNAVTCVIVVLGVTFTTAFAPLAVAPQFSVAKPSNDTCG